MKITQQEYEKFLEHYAWMLLKTPDYRLGQAFLNYFPQVSRYMSRQGKEGTIAEMRLFYSNEIDQVQHIIDQWRQQ